MAKYRIIYGLIYIAAAVFALSYESKLSLVLFVGVAVLPVLTFLLLVLSLVFIKVEALPQESWARKLESFEVKVRIHNYFIIPASPLKITGVFHDTDGIIKGGRILIVNSMPLSVSEYEFGGNIRYRGEYTLGPEQVELYDLLKIFRLHKRLTPDCRAVIVPRRISLNDDAAIKDNDYDSSMTNVSFFDNNEFSSVRKYEDGDLMKHVHWKLSAKQDELMVKQMEQNLGNSAVIVTDTCAFSEVAAENMRCIDAVIESALAITLKIVSDGKCAVNVFRSAEGATRIVEVRTTDDYERLFSMYCLLPSQERSGGALSLLKDAENYLDGTEPLFIITPRMDWKTFSAVRAQFSGNDTKMRIYLTAASPDDELAAASEIRNISVYGIDPDHVSLSLNRSMLKG